MADSSEDGQEWQDGLAAFKASKWEDAVQHIGQALQARIEASGGEAAECAELYYHYGAALFYRAQEESDVFGAPIENTVTAHDAGPSNGAGPSSSGAPQEPPSAEASNPEGNAANGEESGNEEEEDADDDMQLAWENLEVAKTIYERNEEANRDRLADIHTLLADLAMEQESFETALTDYKSAFEIVKQAASADGIQAQDRKMAELHFKIGLVLQFLQNPREALQEVEAAIAICSKCLNSTGGAALDESEKSGLQSVLEDLQAKQEELKQAVEELQKQKETIQAALKKAFGSVGSTVPSASGSASQSATGPPQLSKVVDLGVVGQGRRRINLAPIPSNTGGGHVATASTAVATGQSAPKRTLDDLMGGGTAKTDAAAPGNLPLTETQKRPRIEPHCVKKVEEQRATGKENVLQQPAAASAELSKSDKPVANGSTA